MLFLSIIIASSEIKSTFFTGFTFFYDIGIKIATKIGESCGIERIAARSETALQSGFRELQKIFGGLL